MTQNNKKRKKGRCVYWGSSFLLSLSILSCTTKKDLSVKELFFNSKKIEIEKMNDVPLIEKTSFEKVTNFANFNNLEENKKSSINEEQKLSEVTVTAQKRTSLIALVNGNIDLQFRIKIPKDNFNEDWRLTLTPYIITDDTTFSILPIYLKGSSFYNSQQESNDKFNSYKNTIVERNKYDSAFFDKLNADKAIARILDKNYTEYQSRFTKQKKTKAWFDEQNYRFTTVNTNRRAKLAKKKNFYNILIKDRIKKEYNQGKDTTGLYNKYMYQILIKEDELEKQRLDTLVIPKKMKDLYFSDYIKNKNFEKSDSILLAADYFRQDKIVLNEDKKDRLEDKKKLIIPFEFETEYFLDSVVNVQNNFDYIYSNVIHVNPNTSKISVYLLPKVDALDKSSYNFPTTDTIDYVIASYAQLADRTIGTTKRLVHKEGIYTVKPDFIYNKAYLSLDNEQNKKELASIYDDFYTSQDKGYIIDSVLIETYTSMNTTFDESAKITIERADFLKNYFKDKFNTPIHSKPKGQDWQTLVVEIKKEDIKTKDRILIDLANTTNPDVGIKEMEKKYPIQWKYVKNNIYPKLERTLVKLIMHYPNIESDTLSIVENIPNYDTALSLINNKEYWKAFEILRTHPDYNTALCLVALNNPEYDKTAKNILLNQIPRINVYYLLAIIAIRQQENDLAIEYLNKVVSEDRTKLNRIKLDTEVREFCAKNNLFNNN